MNDRILTLYPQLKILGDIYYLEPVECLISGFTLERAGNGSYIWLFRYPLFCRASTLSLTFSERVAGPTGYVEHSEAVDEITHIASVIEESLTEAEDMLSLAKFVNHLETNLQLLRNPRIRQAYAFSLILTERYDEGKEQLLLCANSRLAASDTAYHSECDLIASDIVAGGDLLLEWVDDMKRRLGI